MRDEELREIEERAKAATPGKWYAILPRGEVKGAFIKAAGVDWMRYQDDSQEVVNGADRDVILYAPTLRDRNSYSPDHRAWGEACRAVEADMEFAAHAREDVPALIAEVRRLQGVASSARREALAEATGKAEEHCAELLEGMSQAARDDDSRTHDRLNHAYGEARHIVDDLRALKDSPAASVRGLVGEVGGENEND